MERFGTVLLDVWREVCRHLEIGESVARVAPILVRRLPVDVTFVRRLDVARSQVETVATGLCQGKPAALSAKNTCSPEALKRLLLWCEAREIMRAPGRDRAGASARPASRRR